LKVVQIGVGGWGKNHSRVLSEFGVLSAVCDANSERAEEFGKKYSVNFYDSYESLLEQEEFDAALVCTPTFTHSDIATRLIENKKHVFVEKPMTYLSEDGQNLVELAKRNNVILTCGYIERFNPAVASVKDFIKSQKYGDLIRLEFYREHRMPQHIKDVGVIYDTSVHDIDTAMWLFDETPEDGWETIRLISELEQEQPNSMFTATPLTFIPIGLLEKSEFYDMGNDSDPTQLGVMYKTWQHNIKYGIKKFMSKTGQRGSVRRAAFNGLARTLGGVPLGAMERYARRKGGEHERILEKVKAQYW